jgi:hypothetical protein
MCERAGLAPKEAIMGEAAIPIREVARTVETFEGRTGPTRIRLRADKIRFIRYVLCEWDGEAGAASSLGPQLALIAQRAVHAPRRTRGDLEGTDVHPREDYAGTWEARQERDAGIAANREGPDPSDGFAFRRYYWAQKPTGEKPWMHNGHGSQSVNPNQSWPQENWSSKRREERASILRAYRTLMALARKSAVDFAIINALYGDLPPGLPTVGMWAKDVDADYRRVCRYAPGAGGSGVRLEQTIRVDRGKRLGETDEARRKRVVEEQSNRADRLREVAKQCEQLIVTATQAYMAAWGAT